MFHGFPRSSLAIELIVTCRIRRNSACLWMNVVFDGMLVGTRGLFATCSMSACAHVLTFLSHVPVGASSAKKNQRTVQQAISIYLIQKECPAENLLVSKLTRREDELARDALSFLLLVARGVPNGTVPLSPFRREPAFWMMPLWQLHVKSCGVCDPFAF